MNNVQLQDALTDYVKLLPKDDMMRVFLCPSIPACDGMNGVQIRAWLEKPSNNIPCSILADAPPALETYLDNLNIFELELILTTMRHMCKFFTNTGHDLCIKAYDKGVFTFCLVHPHHSP